MITQWARIDRSLLVVNVELATDEWVIQWETDNPDSDFIYREAHEALEDKCATIGSTYDEETTWFIPPAPGQNYTFDKEVWHWVEDTP